MASHQPERVCPNADQLIKETERKLDQQLALIDSLLANGKGTGIEMKALAVLLDTLDEALEYKLIERGKLGRNAARFNAR